MRFFVLAVPEDHHFVALLHQALVTNEEENPLPLERIEDLATVVAGRITHNCIAWLVGVGAAGFQLFIAADAMHSHVSSPCGV